MSLTVSRTLLDATTCLELGDTREAAVKNSHYSDREVSLDVSVLSDEALVDVGHAAGSIGDKKTQRAVDAILKGRAGTFSHPLPSFMAFEGVLRSFISVDLSDGWLYVRHHDGKLYPELVTSIVYDSNESHRGKATPSVQIRTAAYGLVTEGRGSMRLGNVTRSHRFEACNVTKKRVADILAEAGLFKETPALKAEYLASQDRHAELTMGGFAKQFRFTGRAHAIVDCHDYTHIRAEHSNRRVVHDLEMSDYPAAKQHVDSPFLAEGVGDVPEHPLVRIFDLKSQEYLWVNADLLTPYVYDKSLRDKLVLPKTHRDLLDVLTTDIEAFTVDIIEGKAAGNVILCTGLPGLGKTLTAEVYAELIEAPLYSVGSGTLGTTAESIEKSLTTVFQQTRRWGCVLLLDEADVFVMQRGNDLEHNAIVAEFLRALEYFDQLMFMTTNRPQDIDEAIISRCAAIIAYDMPTPDDAAAIWRVMGIQFENPLNEALIARLLALFPKIAPRDIKMLLRLALRVSRQHVEPLDIEVFRRCAMFRAIKMAEELPAVQSIAA